MPPPIVYNCDHTCVFHSFIDFTHPDLTHPKKYPSHLRWTVGDYVVHNVHHQPDSPAGLAYCIAVSPLQWLSWGDSTS